MIIDFKIRLMLADVLSLPGEYYGVSSTGTKSRCRNGTGVSLSELDC